MWHSDRFEEAEKKCRELLEEDPKNASIWSLLASCLTSQRKYDEAEKAVRKAMNLGSTESVTLETLGKICLNTNRFQKAEESYRKAIELSLSENPLDGEAPASFWKGLGLALLHQGKNSDAEEALDKSLSLDPENGPLWTILGSLQLGRNDLFQAEVSVGCATMNSPNFKEAWILASRVLIPQKRFEEAEKTIRKAFKLGDITSMDLSILGKILNGLERYSEAEDTYRNAIEMHEKESSEEVPYGYLKGLSTSLWKQDKYEEAEPVNKRWAKIYPKDKDVWLHLAHTQFKLGKMKNIDDYARKAIQLTPEKHLAWTVLSRGLYFEKKFDEAEKAVRKAIELKDDDPGSWVTLGEILREMKRYQEAEDPFRKAIDLWTKMNRVDRTAEIWRELAFCVFSQKRHDEGISHLVKSLEIDNSDRTTHLYVALFQSRAGRLDEAEIKLLEITRVWPDFGTAWAILGSVYDRLGKSKEADRAKKKAKELN